VLESVAEMKWFDPLDSSKPVISPQAQIDAYRRKIDQSGPPGIHDRFLMLLAGDDVASLRSGFRVNEEGHLPAFLGRRPIYTIKGRPPISLIERTFAAPVAVDALEMAVALGARQLFFSGFCGAVADRLAIGDVVIPTSVKREEGTSYHYMPQSGDALPDGNLAGQLADYLHEQSTMQVHEGRTVTTDAVFRQTLNRELGWRNQGILGVDMEMSALLAVARFHQLPAVGLFVVSDKHSLEEESQWHWGGQKLTESHATALDLLVGFIKAI
jgi:purine-nucleoside phosphorylase